MPEQLREILIRKRVALGLSQRELARKAKVSHTVISRFESGEAHPNTVTLEAISTALGFPFNQIFQYLSTLSLPASEAYPTQAPPAMEEYSSEQELAEQLKRLHREKELILQAAGEGIYGLDLEGRTTFVNPAAARMIGWTPEELIGKPQHEILHHSRPDGSFYPREECPIYRAFMDGQVHHIGNEVFWRKDGSSFPVEYISTPIRNEKGEILGAVVTFKDVSNRRNIAEQLRQSEAKYQTLVNSISQIIFNTDPQGNVTVLNPTGLNYFGQTLQSLPDWRWFQCIHPEDIQPVIQCWSESIQKEGAGSFSCRLKRHDADYENFQITMSAIMDKKGAISFWVGHAARLDAQL